MIVMVITRMTEKQIRTTMNKGNDKDDSNNYQNYDILNNNKINHNRMNDINKNNRIKLKHKAHIQTHKTHIQTSDK